MKAVRYRAKHSCLIGVALFLSAVGVGTAPAAAASSAQELSPICNEINDPKYDGPTSATSLAVPSEYGFIVGEVITLVAYEALNGDPTALRLRLISHTLPGVEAVAAFPGPVHLEIPANGYSSMSWEVLGSGQLGYGYANLDLSCGPWRDSDDDGSPDHADPDDDNDELDDTLDPDPLDSDADDDGISDGEDVEWLEDAIGDVPASSIKSPAEGNRTAMLSILKDVEKLIASGNRAEAVRKLRSLLGKVDGCGTKADKNDWIINCGDQLQIRGLIQELISNLTT